MLVQVYQVHFSGTSFWQNFTMWCHFLTEVNAFIKLKMNNTFLQHLWTCSC